MTSAVTPNASKHDQLPPLASRFVDVAALPWTKTAYPGIEAKTLLLDRNRRISEVAYDVGFQSLTHFNRIFRKLVGASPSSYRRSVFKLT